MVTRIERPEGNRVESGVVQFGEDWPGVFIRGDEALALAHMILSSQQSGFLPKGNQTLQTVVDALLACKVEH